MDIRQDTLALRLTLTLLCGFSLLICGGCGVQYGVVGQPAPADRYAKPLPIPQAKTDPAPQQPLPATEAPAIPTPEPVPEASQLLLASAREQRQNGDLARAATTLERALRMAPNDPYLWHELARVRLAEQAWQQAIQLANRSRILAADNQKLRQQNSEIIAAASSHL